MENRISIEISEADLKLIREAFQTIRSVFSKYAKALTPEERQQLPKMADGTEAFVLKTMEFVVSDPQFNPPFMSVEELKKDLDLYFVLKPFSTVANQLSDEFGDTVMLAGSEAYTTCLAYYNSVKLAARMNVPGAKAIYEELRKRFERRSQRA